MRGAASAVAGALLFCCAADAGAWTLPRGTALIISGVTSSHASMRFDGGGQTAGPVVFNKLFVQNWMEYGLSDAFTLVLAPQYVMADTGAAGARVDHFASGSVEAGGRLLLSKRIGMLSLQATAKTAGAFDMSIAASGEGGRQLELRLLYGTGFKIFGRDGFVDVEAGRRWVGRPRPDETALDVTLGLRPAQRDLILLQSFSVISDGVALRPYEPYRQFKLQASLVHQFTRHWSLQSGYFITPAGRNTVKETGLVSSLWLRL